MSTPTHNPATTGPRFAVSPTPLSDGITVFRVLDTQTGQRPEAVPFDYAMPTMAQQAADRLNDSGALLAAIVAALKVADPALALGGDNADRKAALEQVEDILRAVLPE